MAMKQTLARKSWWLLPPMHAIGFILMMGVIVFMITVGVAVFTNAQAASVGKYQGFIDRTCIGSWWTWI